MKPRTYAVLGMILSIFSLTACNQPAESPQTWLDRPLDNSTIPLAPFIIQAHASDSNGVVSFEFYVDDTLLSSVGGNGNRLSEAFFEWTPPEPGIYTVKARAINVGSSAGGYATSRITVDGEITQYIPTPTSTFTTTTVPEGAEPLCSLEQLVAPELLEPADGADVATPVHFAWRYPKQGCHPHSWRIDISELADFSDSSWGFGTLDHLETSRDWPLPAGRCYYWRALAYIPDDYGPPSAARRFCIPTTPTPQTATLTPTTTATLTPVPSTSTSTPTATSSPVADTSPPFFIGTKFFPDQILTEGSGCSTYARATNVEAHVVDSESIIASVWVVWSVGAESGQTTLSSIGGDYYQGAVGPVNTVGTLSITIYAQDTAGNRAQSNTLYVTVQNCVE
jgi:hypothetical protein